MNDRPHPLYTARYMKIKGQTRRADVIAITRRCMLCGADAVQLETIEWNGNYCAGKAGAICMECHGRCNVYVYEEWLNNEPWLMANLGSRCPIV